MNSLIEAIDSRTVPKEINSDCSLKIRLKGTSLVTGIASIGMRLVGEVHRLIGGQIAMVHVVQKLRQFSLTS